MLLATLGDGECRPGTPATWKRGRNNGRSEVRRGCSRSGHCWPTCSLEQTRLIDFVGTHGNVDRHSFSVPSPSSPSFHFFSLLFLVYFCFVFCVYTDVRIRTSNLTVAIVFKTGFEALLFQPSRGLRRQQHLFLRENLPSSMNSSRIVTKSEYTLVRDVARFWMDQR